MQLREIIVFIGILIFLHAAYSAHHYKSLAMKLGELDSVSLPPSDVILEIIFSFLMMLITLVLPMKFVPIVLSQNKSYKTWEESTSRPDFFTFNHRGRMLSKIN
mmetsp:Transcript_41076/g.41961  ORF Transcript_41076/g.41961 Transcript_41076/m.41961 type:complete len:104 (+) Transcript_41076:164-475(+)